MKTSHTLNEKLSYFRGQLTVLDKTMFELEKRGMEEFEFYKIVKAEFQRIASIVQVLDMKGFAEKAKQYKGG